MSSLHPAAVIDPRAEIGSDVEIGPYCVIGPDVKIGDGARLISHVVVDGCTTIGAGCTLFPFACVGTQTQDLKFRGGHTSVEIGERTTLREYVTVNAGTNEGEVTVVGADCHILAYCHVAHACRLGSGVIMSNSTHLAGDVQIGDRAVLGGLTGVHQFCRIGTMCMIGACTKITKDCPPYMIVDGNPAAVHGPNSVGLQRNNVSPAARQLIKSAYRLLYREDIAVSQAVERIRTELESCPELEHLTAFVTASERGIVH